MRLGNENPEIGNETLFKTVKKMRGAKGGRIYFRKVNGKIQVLAKSGKIKRDQKVVIKILRRMYS